MQADISAGLNALLRTSSRDIGAELNEERRLRNQESRRAKQEARLQQQEARNQKQFELDQLRQGFALQSDREQARYKSLIQGAVEISPFLDNDDLDGAEDFLTNRIEQLDKLGIDSSDSRRELEDFLDDPEMFKKNVKSAIGYGQQLGIIKTPDASLQGGATGILANRLRQENPDLSLQDALFQIKGGLNKGLTVGQDGKITNIEGFNQARASTAKAEKEGGLQAELALKPKIAKEQEAAKISAKNLLEAKKELIVIDANMPKLEKLVGELAVLAEKATFSAGGVLMNTGARLSGNSTKGGVARAEYIAKADNEVLPLMRVMFGAAFTENEGKRVTKLLGDPNATPAEKQAQLEAFIEGKKAELEVQRRIYKRLSE